MNVARPGQDEALTKVIEELLARLPSVPAEDQKMVKAAIEEVREQAKSVQSGDETPERQNALVRRLKSLIAMAHDIGEVAITTLANPALGVSLAIQKIAKKAQEEVGHA